MLFPVGDSFAVRKELHEVHSGHQHEDQQKQQCEHSVDLGLNGLFRVGIDFHRQGYKIQTGDEIADDEVIQTHGKGHDGAGHHAGHDLVEGHPEEGLPGGAAQVHGRVRQGDVHLLELGHDV